MSNVTPFQVILLGFFGVALVFAVLVFSGIIPLFNKAPDGVAGEVVLWGTFPSQFFRDPILELNRNANGLWNITYIQKEASTFDTELVEALASGRGPDALLLSHDLIMRHRDKVFPIPYESISKRVFLDTFIEEGELFLSSDGALAFPATVDPLVMYVNRDIFSGAGISQYPTVWDEFFTLALDLTKIDAARNITQSSVALGEFGNIMNAKEILSLLIMQAGNPIISVSDEGVISSVLENRGDTAVSPAESSVRFYTEFSNPAKSAYSWNRALPDSKDMFLAGDLAVYFGFASEFSDMRAKSPHLNFDIAMIPQIRDSIKKTTYARMTGYSVLKQARNPETAFYIISLMSGADFVKSVSDVSALPPVRRDVLARVPADASGSVLYSSALISRAWLDPNPPQTGVIFGRMIDSVISGRERVSEAVTRASRDIGALLPQ